MKALFQISVDLSTDFLHVERKEFSDFLSDTELRLLADSNLLPHTSIRERDLEVAAAWQGKMRTELKS